MNLYHNQLAYAVPKATEAVIADIYLLIDIKRDLNRRLLLALG